MEPRGLHLDPGSHAYKHRDLEQGLWPVRLSVLDHERVITVPPGQEAVDEMKQVKPCQRRLKRSWLLSSAVIATIASLNSGRGHLAVPTPRRAGGPVQRQSFMGTWVKSMVWTSSHRGTGGGAV